MPFIITATTEHGAVSFQRDSPLSAHEKALELQRLGERDVLISGPDGELHAPADFDRLFVQDPDPDLPED
ncbi:hypothetical protein [Aurantimonas sp. HBX-1]|uniref:hypothetical protein n=1 Tax=Aurantimonas sp. HBX-1 TaxID=2906072 RepID=UPI001F2C9CD7|nr:hypothetical protein [Aurantimonas sp. HBX-1]UIJ73361.1 hypothetical protein LXB15_06905 [Aurantimonas sp. HBX-1]